MSLDWIDDPRMLAPPRSVRVALDGGGLVLRSPEPLQSYARCIGEWLERWARETPDAPAFAERTADASWRRLTWGQARIQVGRIAQSLLGMDPDGLAGQRCQLHTHRCRTAARSSNGSPPAASARH